MAAIANVRDWLLQQASDAGVPNMMVRFAHVGDVPPDTGYNAYSITTDYTNPAAATAQQATAPGLVMLTVGPHQDTTFTYLAGHLAAAASYPNIQWVYVYDEFGWNGSSIDVVTGYAAIVAASAQVRAAGLLSAITCLPEVIVSSAFAASVDPNQFDVIGVDIYPSLGAGWDMNGRTYNSSRTQTALKCSVDALRDLGFTGQIWYVYQAFGVTTDTALIAHLSEQVETIRLATSLGAQGLVSYGLYDDTGTNLTAPLYAGSGTGIEQYVHSRWIGSERFAIQAPSGTVDFTNVTGPTKPADNATVGATWGTDVSNQPTDLAGINAGEGSKLAGIAAGADVTTSILANSGTTVTMTSSTLFRSTSGLGGVFVGAGGLIGKDGSGNTTFAVDGATGAPTFAGTITGGADIDITGGAKVGGSKTSASFGSAAAAGVFNDSLGTVRALIGVANSTAQAIVGYQINASGVAVHAENSAGGTALLSQGKFSLSNATFTWNGYVYSAPAGSGTTVLHNDGIWRDPVTTARVNAAFGVAASAVVQGVGPDAGAIVYPSGGGISILSTVSGVQTYGSGSVVTIQSVSDRRLKEDIEDEDLGLDFVMAQRLRRYRMKGDPTWRHGWIFDEVKQHVHRENDSLAMLNPNGFGGVDTTGMVAVLMHAVQQLNRRIPVPLAERLRRWFNGVKTWL